MTKKSTKVTNQMGFVHCQYSFLGQAYFNRIEISEEHKFCLFGPLHEEEEMWNYSTQQN